MEQHENDVDDETELALTLSAMQRDLERELDTIGGMVGRFRAVDAPVGEDLARNTMRAYDAIADVIRMVRTVRGIDPADRMAAASKVVQVGDVYETSASEFFAEGGPAGA